MEKSIIRGFFLSEKAILILVLLNTLSIFIGGYFPGAYGFVIADCIFTLLFIFEAVVKIKTLGWKNYWADGWNRFNFIITVVAIPSLANLFIEDAIATNVFLAFRVLRVFKAFRLFRFVPNISSILRGIKLAIKASFVVTIRIFNRGRKPQEEYFAMKNESVRGLWLGDAFYYDNEEPAPSFNISTVYDSERIRLHDDTTVAIGTFLKAFIERRLVMEHSAEATAIKVRFVPDTCYNCGAKHYFYLVLTRRLSRHLTLSLLFVLRIRNLMFIFVPSLSLEQRYNFIIEKVCYLLKICSKKPFQRY